MRVFLDENIPRPLRHLLTPHEGSFVEREGWKGKSNGALLRLIAGRFDVLLTADGSLAFQNELAGRGLSAIIVPTNNLDVLRLSAPAIRVTLDELVSVAKGAVLVTIRWNGRRTLRSLSHPGAQERDLDPVPRFTRNVF